MERKFGFRDKIGYMFGDFGNDFFFMLASTFPVSYTHLDVYKRQFRICCRSILLWR